jgi:peptidyl-prolyl cis-trans isomerase SurA
MKFERGCGHRPGCIDESTRMGRMNLSARIGGVIGVFAAALVISVSSGALAQNVVAVVNGDPITALDIEQRTKFVTLTTQKTPTRTQVLNDLIDEKLKVREGKRWGLEVGDSDLEAAYAGMAERMHKTAAQLNEDLEKSGVNPATLKARTRADIVWQQLVRGRYSSSLQPSDKDVELALAKDSEPAEPATEYTIRPILLLVPPGSAPTAYDNRRKDAESLRARFKSCQEGLPAARAMEGAVIRDQVVRNSADLQPELRKVLAAIPVGQLSAPETTKLGVELFAICSKRETKNDSAEKRKARDAIFSKRFEEQSREYLRRLRREALIERK